MPEPFPQTFLLRGQSGETAAAGSGLARGERHPQRSQRGTPVRGGDTKKGGKGGKGTWGAPGLESEPPRMRNGAIDSHDPNYSSSGSSEEEHETPERVTRPGSVPAPSALPQHQPPEHHSQPQSAATFKRVPLEQLFGQAAAPAALPAPAGLPAPQQQQQQQPPQQQQQQAQDKRKSEQYAGGAHHNIPEASALPLPASLGGTPQKQASRPGGALGAGSPDAAQRLEQSLKALLRINS